MKIKSIKTEEISDSKGSPTVEVELTTDFGTFSASVPSGVSTGKYEAVELRDEDGGVKKAIENVEKIIAPALEKEDLTDQKKNDQILIDLDGTKNKSRLGANAILAVSMAACRAIAASKNLPLYQYISQLSEIGSRAALPKPSFNMVEGGKHALSTSSGQAGLAFQEFMVIPQKESFRENLEMGIKIYRKLGEILDKKFGKENVKLSRESAFSPPVSKISEALDLIMAAAEETGEKENIRIAIDAAASEFYENGKYRVDDKDLSKEELIDFYQNIVQKYPIISIEDPFAQEDYEAWSAFKYKIQDTKYKIHIFGDDLTVTNLERMKMAEEKNACNGVIIKPNQIGTVSETIKAAKLARSYALENRRVRDEGKLQRRQTSSNGWKIMVSNRAGETEDDFIADLAAGIGADFIKSGAPFAKERMTKYNRLVKIEEEQQ